MRVSKPLAAGINAARSAPSAHNVQPWTFDVTGHSVVLGWSVERELRHGDPKGRYLITGLGAAAEAFTLGSAADGSSVAVEFDWKPRESTAARLTLTQQPPDPMDVELGFAIPQRQTTRWPYARSAIPASDLSTLTEEAERVGCTLMVVTDRRLIRKVARLTGRGTALNFADAQVFSEFAGLLRMTRKDPAYRRDGLTLETLASNPLQAALSRVVLQPNVMRLMVLAGLHRLVARTQTSLMRKSSAIALLVCSSHEPADVFSGGRAMLRVWTRAAQLGLRTHPMTAAMDHAATRAQLSGVFGADADAPQIVCLRLGYGSGAPQSPRLPEAELVVGGVARSPDS